MIREKISAMDSWLRRRFSISLPAAALSALLFVEVAALAFVRWPACVRGANSCVSAPVTFNLLAPAAAPVASSSRVGNVRERKKLAWVTSAYGNGTGYLNQALVLIASLRAHGATEDILILDGTGLAPEYRARVEQVGGRVYGVEPVAVPEKVARGVEERRHLPNFVRLRMWNMTEYEKVIFLDGDMLAVKDISPMRAFPCLSASVQKWDNINGGMLVLCPNQSIAEAMMEELQKANRIYPVAEQTFITSFFWKKWTLVSTCYNARTYKYFPFLKKFIQFSLQFWPPRDICNLDDAVLVHFSSLKKPWNHLRCKMSRDILDLYDEAIVKYLPPQEFAAGGND